MEMKVQVSKITISMDSIPDLVLVGAYLVEFYPVANPVANALIKI